MLNDVDIYDIYGYKPLNCHSEWYAQLLLHDRFVMMITPPGQSHDVSNAVKVNQLLGKEIWIQRIQSHPQKRKRLFCPSSPRCGKAKARWRMVKYCKQKSETASSHIERVNLLSFKFIYLVGSIRGENHSVFLQEQQKPQELTSICQKLQGNIVCICLQGTYYTQPHWKHCDFSRMTDDIQYPYSQRSRVPQE